MLKFESLELLGFKSFADKARVVFDNHVTAIVGPNGCGKSNLSDALGWTLGVQTAHGLRGQKMEDLIFNGTRKRQPSGLARVTLTVSREGEAPLVLNGEELDEEKLTITHRLYRSGESAYLINGRRCRLKDIHRFMDESGLGFAPYALIAQGKIDHFLNAKALERRTIIEEAAQISAYRSRRRSAELKLEAAQQNLLRVADIVSEIERQLRSLKRQANKARRFRELKQEFQSLQRAKFSLQAEALQARQKSLGEELEGIQASAAELSGELARCEGEYQESVSARESLESRLSGLRQKKSDIHLERDRAVNSRRYHREQIESISKYLQNNAAERQSIEQALEKVRQDSESFRRQRQQLVEEEAGVKAEQEKCLEGVEAHSLQLNQAESALEELRQKLVRLTSETASLENQQEQLQGRLESSLEAGEELAIRLSQLRSGLEEARQQQQTARQRSTELEEQISRLHFSLEEQQGREDDLALGLKEIQQEQLELQSQLIAARERLQSLQEVEISRSQYSQSVQKLLSNLKRNGNLQTGGTLADFVETDPEFERLVEEFLDEELEYVLVDSLQDAVQGVSEVKNLKAGKCTFMSLTSNGFKLANGTAGQGSPLAGEEGVYGTLGELLQMKPNVREAFVRVLPQQADALVVSDLDRAFHLAHSNPQATFITLEGEALTPSGLLSATAAQSKKLGLLGLKRQKRELEKKLADSQKSMAQMEAKKTELQRLLEAAAAQRRQTQSQLHQFDKDLVGFQHEANRCSAEVDRQERSLKEVEDQIARHEEDYQALQQKLREIRSSLQGKAGQRSEAEALLSERRNTLQQLRQETEQVQAQLHSINSDRKVLEERRTAMQRASSRLQEQIEGLESRRDSNRQAHSDNEKRLQEMRLALAALEEKLQLFGKQADEVAASLLIAEREYAQWREAHPQIESRLKVLRERKSELQEERSQLDIERAKVETQLESIHSQCQELLQMTLAEAASGIDLENLSLESVLGPYRERKNRLEGFGPVNMTALQEYQEAEERHEFLTKQRGDIEQSIADTTRAIQELNRRSREKFQQAFEEINNHFKVLFQKLFGGGDCGMRLLDEEDLLESGLDVFAQPPGKKLQHVSLLSGGEKALTGLALLMALFQYRPSRFCILDEVDAPLDDANILRFCGLVQEMTEQTQFIIITHNKRSMEIANAIFGVTMQEPGVSQLVSVKF